MYEIDILPVGDEGQSGDAIAMRFTRPDGQGTAHVIIDAGFDDDGVALVDHVQRYRCPRPRAAFRTRFRN
jgi:hypothetical protein